MHRIRASLLTLALLLLLSLPVFAIGEDTGAGAGDAARAVIQNDEGGPVVLRGSVTYTNPFFTLGTAQPLIILEDQAGFVDRNEYFIFPPESQVLGQITSDFFTSPFTYSLALPIAPQGSLRDVDNNGRPDTGVMVFAVAYWSNIFGDPFLEERDLFGGGWSTAYASTRTSIDPDAAREIVGGMLLVYAPDDQQGFPVDFGPDGLLFTGDEETVLLPQGYTLVNLDTQPFTFDRSQSATVDLIEPDSVAVDYFSNLGYTAAFDAMVAKLSKEYAFTEYRGLDWAALSATYRSRFQAAESLDDATAYALALRDFLWEIPDGHVSMSLDPLISIFQAETAGGIGIAIRELSDGSVVVNYLVPNTPAAQAGMVLGTEIIAMNGVPIAQVLDDTFVWAHQALGTPHTLRLQQLRYATRFELGESVDVTFRNPDGAEQTVTLTSVAERDSFASSSFNVGITGIELPVEFRILPSGYGYVAIYSFSDNELLTVQLWERMIQTFNNAQVPGVIVDMRNNGGGSGFLADQMSAYFFNESLIVGQSGRYNEILDDFYFDERGKERLYLPPEELRYLGPLAVIVAPSCFSACEFFSYNLTLQDRAEIVGHYPSGGLGGGVEDFYMPGGISVRTTASRAVDPDGNIHIEGKGVTPTVLVPVTLESLLSTEDVLLAAAELSLTQQIRGVIVEAGALSLGTLPGAITANAALAPGQAVQYRVTLPPNARVSFFAGDEQGILNPVLRLYDSSGRNLTFESSGGAQGFSAAIEDLTTPPQAITLLVELSDLSAQAASQFTLRIEAQPASDE